MKIIKHVAIGLIATTFWSIAVYASFSNPVSLDDRWEFYNILAGDINYDSSDDRWNILQRLQFITQL